MNIESIPEKVNRSKTKKKNKNPDTSLHRDNKTAAHTTIGGKGIIARIRNKKR